MKSERLKTRRADCDSIKIPEGLRPRKSQNFSSSLIAEKNKTKQNKIWLGFKAIKQEEFPLTQGKVSIFIFFKLSTDWKKGPSTLGSVICLTQLTDSSVNQKHAHRNTRMAFDQMPLHPMAQSSWCIKLIIWSLAFVNLACMPISWNHL